MKDGQKLITDINEINEILTRCNSLSLGMSDEACPYIIPMTFGNAVENGRVVIYIHCAEQGHKRGLLLKNPGVCVEAHIYERVEVTGPGHITARFESVIGFGKAVQIASHSEKVDAMKIMLDHYNSTGFPITSCTGLNRVVIYRIELESVTAKRN